MCVCMYLCMHVCMYVCMYIYHTYECMYIRMYAYMYVCTLEEPVRMHMHHMRAPGDQAQQARKQARGTCASASMKQNGVDY